MINATIKSRTHWKQQASHVLHMPSHLYTDLGMWRDAAHANTLSLRAGHHMCHFLEEQHISLTALDDVDFSHFSPLLNDAQKWNEKQKLACDADNIYHSLEWLQYENLQLGLTAKSAALVQQMRRVANVEKATLPEPLIEKSTDKHWAAYSECGLLLADGERAIAHHQTQFMPLIAARFNQIISQLTALRYIKMN